MNKKTKDTPELLEAIKAMMHDIDIFYSKYREPGNVYYKNLKAAISNAENEARFYTIDKKDIGAYAIKAFGRSWPVAGFLGRVTVQDVGKRVYLVEDDVQVENKEQFNQRTNP